MGLSQYFFDSTNIIFKKSNSAPFERLGFKIGY